MRRCPTNLRRVNLGGFTLLEIMLTLAVMMAIAALGWPILQGTFERQRLLSGGNQLRGAFALARANAINSGDVQAMQFGDDQTAFKVDRWVGEVAGGTDVVDDTDTLPTAFNGQLPEGVSVATVNPLGDGSAVSANTSSAGTGASGSQTGSATGASGSASGSATADSAATILFYPDGTCTSCEVALVDKKQRSLSVVLHGLTGSSALTEIVGRDSGGGKR